MEGNLNAFAYFDYEMVYIRQLRLSLYVQSDLIHSFKIILVIRYDLFVLNLTTVSLDDSERSVFVARLHF